MVRLMLTIASGTSQGEYDSVCFAGVPYGEIEPCKSANSTIHVYRGCDHRSGFRLASIKQTQPGKEKVVAGAVQLMAMTWFLCRCSALHLLQV
jgi:hypothetical protein